MERNGNGASRLESGSEVDLAPELQLVPERIVSAEVDLRISDSLTQTLVTVQASVVSAQND